MFFNYGHFYTTPANMYLYEYLYNPSGTGVSPSPNTDLDLPRTIMYELGLERQFTNSLYARWLGIPIEPQWLVSIAGFYKDVSREIGYKRYYLTQTDMRTVAENKRYAQIRGAELRLYKRVGRFLTGWFQGEISLRDQGAVGLLEENSSGTQNVPESAYALTSLAEPTWSLFLDLHTPRNFSVFGLPPKVSELWALRYDMSYSTGALTVYNPNNEAPPPAPNVRYRDNWASNLSLSKGFSYGAFVGDVSLTVSNILGYRSLSSLSMTPAEWQRYLRSLRFPIDDVSISPIKGNDRIGDWPSYAEIPMHDSWAHFTNPRTYTLALNLRLH